MNSAGASDETQKPLENSESETPEATEPESETKPEEAKQPDTAEKVNDTESQSESAKTDKNATNTNTTITAQEKKPKVVLVKEILGSEVESLDLSPLDGETFKKSAEK
jgi:hypothetical protein